MFMKNYNHSFILFLITFLIFINELPVMGQAQELEIYDEWYCSNSNLIPERPFFVIKDTLDFHSFWSKTNFGGYPPHIDFDKYMVFVWAPKPTRKDCNKVEFEKILYKDGSLLVIMNFEGFDKYMTGALKKPIKAAIFPKIKSGDIFIYSKKKIGWENFEYVPYYALWDMDNDRKRPFEFVYVDKDNKPLYEVATTTGNTSVSMATTIVNHKTEPDSKIKPVVEVKTENSVYTPRQSAVSMPNQLPEAKTLSMPKETAQTTVQPAPTTSVNQQSNTVKTVSPATKVPARTTSEPINIGNTPSQKIDKDVKPEVAPGMGEDPLFGSEFDITF